MMKRPEREDRPRPQISITLPLILAWLSLSFIWDIGFSLLRLNAETALSMQHVLDAIGIPIAAAAVVAFTVVALAHKAVGPLEFKIFGTMVKGNSGEVLLWVVCFLVICLAFTILC